MAGLMHTTATALFLDNLGNKLFETGNVVKLIKTNWLSRSKTDLWGFLVQTNYFLSFIKGSSKSKSLLRTGKASSAFVNLAKFSGIQNIIAAKRSA